MARYAFHASSAKAVRPAQLDQIVTAGRLGGEALRELRCGAQIVLHPASILADCAPLSQMDSRFSGVHARAERERCGGSGQPLWGGGGGFFFFSRLGGVVCGGGGGGGGERWGGAGQPFGGGGGRFYCLSQLERRCNGARHKRRSRVSAPPVVCPFVRTREIPVAPEEAVP